MSPPATDLDASLPVGRANAIATLLFPVAVAPFVVPFYVVWGGAALESGLDAFVRPAVFLASVLLGTVVHEWLHGLGFAIFGGVPWSAISFGMHWRHLVPFAHCRVAVPVAVYRRACALPGVALGLLPGLVGLALGAGGLVLWAALMFGGAMGDALALWAIRRLPRYARVLDHPSRLGCLVLTDDGSGPGDSTG